MPPSLDMTPAHPRPHDALDEILDEDDAVPAAGPSSLPPPADLARIRSNTAALPTDVEAGLKSNKPENDIYDRFPVRQKRFITAIVSFAALLAPFASSSFLPSIPQIARDLNVSESVVNYTVAIYLVCIGIAPLVWAPYATIYGRRPIYLVSLPIFIGGSIGVALSRSLGQLIATRTIQAIGSSSVLSVGAGSIGDIFRPTERGRAMGIFYAGALVGPALAPVVAGVLTEYARGPAGGWRAVQWLLAGMGAASSCAAFFLPETIHVRGVDKIVAERAARRVADGKAAVEGAESQRKKKRAFVWVWVNPLRSIGLLRYPNVLAISLNSSFVLLTTYCLLVPLTSTLGPRFGITNSAILGTLYLATGFGNLIGSRIAGHLSDRAVRVWMGKRAGERVPEDRLRATLVAGGIVVPLSLVGTGLTMQFWTTNGGLAVSLLFLVISGIGLMGVLAINNTYLVDVLQGRSVEAIAVNNCMRYLFSAGASAGVLPLINAIGIAPTNAIAAAISWLGFTLVLATIRWGPTWRAGVEDRGAARSERRAGAKAPEERVRIEKMSRDAEKDEDRVQTLPAGIEASRRTSMTLHEKA